MAKLHINKDEWIFCVVLDTYFTLIYFLKALQYPADQMKCITSKTHVKYHMPTYPCQTKHLSSFIIKFFLCII